VTADPSVYLLLDNLFKFLESLLKVLEISAMKLASTVLLVWNCASFTDRQLLARILSVVFLDEACTSTFEGGLRLINLQSVLPTSGSQDGRQ
jgi:hypothetical protein